MAFLLDTSAINRICDDAAPKDRWLPVYITDLVLLELSHQPDTVRRETLLAVLHERLGPGCIVRSEGPVTYRYDEIDPFDNPYDAPMIPLGRAFPFIMRSIGRNHRRHWKDAFIVQAAMMNGLILVTADRKQARAARQFGVSVDFIN